MTRKRKIILWSISTLLVAALVGGGLLVLEIRKGMQLAHKHCIKVTGGAFRSYAGDHAGLYPTNPNGFGDALLLLVKSNYVDVAHICGPNDDGRLFLEALTNGTDVVEETCSRVYVQGLGDDLKSPVCMLYDRKSHPGGDHFYGMGQSLREYIDNHGVMGTVTDDRWPEFSRQQVKLLVEFGFTREQAEYYFPDAKQ